MDSLLPAECMSTFCDNFYGIDEFDYSAAFVGELENAEVPPFNNNIDFNNSSQSISDWNSNISANNIPCELNNRNASIDNDTTYPTQKKQAELSVQGQSNALGASYLQPQFHPQNSFRDAGFSNPEPCTDFVCDSPYMNMNSSTQDAENTPFMNVCGTCDPTSILTLCPKSSYDSENATAFSGEWNNYYQQNQPLSPQSTRQSEYVRAFAQTANMYQNVDRVGSGHSKQAAEKPSFYQKDKQKFTVQTREGVTSMVGRNVPEKGFSRAASTDLNNNNCLTNFGNNTFSANVYPNAGSSHSESQNLNASESPSNNYVFSSLNSSPYSSQQPFSPSCYVKNSQFSSNRCASSEWSNTEPNAATATPAQLASSGSYSPVYTKKRSRFGVHHSTDRERRVRPKVVAEKGALQCRGVNRKKGSRCRNAALMEYIGPRPLYCAEHIPLDPDSYYNKCASTFHKAVGDGKGCREVVLKEFGFCHKHYTQAIDLLLDGTEEGWHKACSRYDRICFLLAQLEAEAAAAKRSDPDLFQRKHKLIPKFMEMKKVLCKRLVEYEASHKYPNENRREHGSPSLRANKKEFDLSANNAKVQQNGTTSSDYSSLSDDYSLHSNSISSEDGMLGFQNEFVLDRPNAGMMGYPSTQINSY
ncbi:uncharacterized protein LOC126316937 [Schistocerca gregaria]|uniref:uncharacterized protein LOC126316937 n=1 Tax=Schistocerca gregaria TaxID=7010 RepID=UPI00211EF844|nr:uncharacterized protein LOC126316937 [Schistocerca gregaria]XP_049848928.1 uncharacterized protein LOC126316937 [Schistocerca gregaria]